MFGFKVVKDHPRQTNHVNTNEITTKSKWWQSTKTDRTRNLILSAGILATIFLTVQFVILGTYTDFVELRIVTVILTLFFFTISELIIYRIYNEKQRLEAKAWHHLHQCCNQAGDDMIHKFFQVYQNNPLIKHSTPFSLIIYESIVAYSTLTILLDMSYDSSININILILLIVVGIIISVKLINDILDLLKNYKKAKALYELFNKNPD